MRASGTGNLLKARAVAGLYVVTLAWDFLVDSAQGHDQLLGFAVERTEFGAAGEPVEKYWLRGVKRFRQKDEGLPPGSPVPTSEHPVQSFQWADYTAKPDTCYSFRIVPAIGKPKLLRLDDAAAVVVVVMTEKVEEPGDTGAPRHNVYFNRGVAGSQAYARKFGKTKPDEDHPESDQMRWLSRGLFEALTGFIALASGPDAAHFKIRAMLYEFHYKPIGDAFKAASDAGADVDIRYEAQSYKKVNEEMIETAAILAICKPQKIRSGIRHNKFIVLLKSEKPIAVWTGSTNISAGGIFGHSNVGHLVWDGSIAKTYLDYWTALAKEDVTAASLRKLNTAIDLTPPVKTPPPEDRILTLFSPRDPSVSHVTSPTLSWYADLLGSAKRIACMTFAFNFDPVFQRAAQNNTDALSYLVFDKALDDVQETEIRTNRNAVLAVGSKLEPGDMENFIGEVLTGFNNNRYIHDKFLLVDPIGSDPIIVTGSANFSNPSQETSDENMLVIRGNLRLADIYFGEFMRIFDHLYVRYIVSKLKAEGKDDPNAGYLKETAADWLLSNFTPGLKEKRRRYFVEG